MIGGVRSALVLGAHPDDEMACSGLVAKLVREGAAVDLLTFSDCADVAPVVSDLEGEWREAAAILGIRSAQLLRLPNRRLPERRQDVLDALDARRWAYDLVLCPATFDAHQDHGTVALEAQRAFKHATLLGYELPLNWVGQARVSGFAHLDAELLGVKLRHLAAYRSQARRPYMDPAYVRSLAAVRGVQAGCEAAEAYEVIRWHA